MSRPDFPRAGVRSASTVTSPVKSRLLPQPGKREDSCSVTADVSLHTFGGRGAITAWLTATKR